MCETSYSDHKETEQEDGMILLFGGLVVRQSLHTKEIPRWGSRICAQDSGLNPWKRAVNAGSSTISSWSLILMAGLQRNDAT